MQQEEDPPSGVARCLGWVGRGVLGGWLMVGASGALGQGFLGTVDEQLYEIGNAIPVLTLPAATGGGGVFTYALSGDELHPGLTIDTDARTIAGAPTTYNRTRAYRWTATDGNGATASLMFSITVGFDVCAHYSTVHRAIVRALQGPTSNVNACESIPLSRLSEARMGINIDTIVDTPNFLKEGEFVGLGNVPSLRIANTRLVALPSGVLDGLDSLTTLTLDDNDDFTTLPAGLFEGSSVSVVEMRRNDLTNLPKGIFTPLGGGLNILLLQQNELSDLHDGFFDGLTGLTSLYLQGNPGATFTLKVSLQRQPNGRYRTYLSEAAPLPTRVTWTSSSGATGTATIERGERVSREEFASSAETVTLSNAHFPGFPNTAQPNGLFQGFRAGVASGTITERPGIAFSTDSLTVDEGASPRYTIRLSVAPIHPVTVTPMPSADNDLTLTPSGGLTFTATTWNIAQTVALTVGKTTTARTTPSPSATRWILMRATPSMPTPCPRRWRGR